MHAAIVEARPHTSRASAGPSTEDLVNLTADLIADTWASVLAEVGELETFSNSQVELPDGTVLDSNESVHGKTIGATTLQCEAGEMVGRVAFDENSMIIGMLVVPTDHGDPPF